MKDFKIMFCASLETAIEAFEQEFDTYEEAKTALDIIANYTLHLHEESLMSDHSNYGSVYTMMTDGSWEEVHNDGEGEDV